MLDGEAILVDAWGPLVRAAVVDRVERATVGRRGVLVRVLGDPDHARYAWTEELHTIVLRAIASETGADLEECGSQAAWAVYDQTWSALASRWADGGGLPRVPSQHESEVVGLLLALPPSVATCLAVDTGVEPFAPLRVAGQILVDVEGLHAAIASDVPGIDTARADLDRLLALLTPAS